MKILNYGSLNIDNVFRVDHIVRQGETIDSGGVQIFPGGKGLNQTLAIARAGAEVFHAGNIGRDGDLLLRLLSRDGVQCQYLRISEVNTGSTFIQVDSCGQNSIVLNGGANRTNTEAFIADVLAGFDEGDILLLQNEINLIDRLIDRAYEKKMFIILNPSPMNESIFRCDLEKVSLFIMNETEGAQITGCDGANDILDAMMVQYPHAKVVLTMGGDGARYRDLSGEERCAAFSVPVRDTTAAGDTFTGYFIAALTEKKGIMDCMRLASKAAALAVMKDGAASSIPFRAEVDGADLLE